jgi:hypothetical protein
MVTRNLFGFEAQAKQRMVRADGLEPSRTLRSNGFSYNTRLRLSPPLLTSAGFGVLGDELPNCIEESPYRHPRGRDGRFESASGNRVASSRSLFVKFRSRCGVLVDRRCCRRIVLGRFRGNNRQSTFELREDEPGKGLTTTVEKNPPRGPERFEPDKGAEKRPASEKSTPASDDGLP